MKNYIKKYKYHTILLSFLILVIVSSLILHKDLKVVNNDNNNISKELKKINISNLALEIDLYKDYTFNVEKVDDKDWVQSNRILIKKGDSAYLSIFIDRFKSDTHLINATGGNPRRRYLSIDNSFQIIGEIENRNLYVREEVLNNPVNVVYISQQTDPNLAAAEMDLWASNSAMDVIHISYWVEENTFERDKEIKKVEDMILSLKRINL